MPGQIIAKPNPPPDPSHLPDSVNEYAVQLKTSNVLGESELRAVQKFRRAANYISAGTLVHQVVVDNSQTLSIAMIFLQDNVLLERPLTFDDIKPRLLGHWGTCPGLVLIYAHLNRIIKKTDLDALLVVGPGELIFPFCLIHYHA